MQHSAIERKSHILIHLLKRPVWRGFKIIQLTTNPPASQPAHHPLHPTNQPAVQSATQWTNQLASKPNIPKPTNQLTNPPDSRSLSHSIN